MTNEWITPPVDESEEGGGRYAVPGRRVITQPYDFSIRTLVDQIDDETLIVQDVYQRNFVWDETRQSRLVESLLLNIPLPVCYFTEDESNTQSVVDGHQRLTSIHNFVKNQLRLRGLRVLTDLNGKRFMDLEQRYKRSLLSRTIRCIVIMRESDSEIRFEVFERLNTGAVPLNAQEIRNCVLHGKLNLMLRELVDYRPWLRILNRAEKDDRMRDCELILRFLALRDLLEKYQPAMKRFLDDYMRDNRNPTDGEIAETKKLFSDTVAKVDSVFGDKAFRAWDGANWEQNTNRALFDAVMLSFHTASVTELTSRKQEILESFKRLCVENGDFVDSISKATGDRTRLLTRLREFGRMISALGISTAILDRTGS